MAGILHKPQREVLPEETITRIVREDKTPWYKKPNLRLLYLALFPACMGVEMTSGFDSQMINIVQIVYTWNKCTPNLCIFIFPEQWFSDTL